MKLKDFFENNLSDYNNKYDFIKDAVKICKVKESTVKKKISQLKIKFDSDFKNNIQNLLRQYKNKLINLLSIYGWLPQKDLKRKLKINNHIYEEFLSFVKNLSIKLDETNVIYVHPDIRKDIKKIIKEVKNKDE